MMLSVQCMHPTDYQTCKTINTTFEAVTELFLYYLCQKKNDSRVIPIKSRSEENKIMIR